LPTWPRSRAVERADFRAVSWESIAAEALAGRVRNREMGRQRTVDADRLRLPRLRATRGKLVSERFACSAQTECAPQAGRRMDRERDLPRRDGERSAASRANGGSLEARRSTLHGNLVRIYG